MAILRSHPSKLPFIVCFGLLLSFAGSPPIARANFHLWFIKEVYSNPSGSVQFVELFTNNSGQEFLSAHTLTSTANIFTFPGNAPSPTNGHHLLLATSGFGSIPGGATPDFTIPSNFFNPDHDTLNFAGGFDIDTFVSAPIDGINSLNYTSSISSSTVATNSPRNYAGNGSSINLAPSPTGDYDGNHVVDAADYVVWRKTLAQSAIPAGSGADGNSSGTIEVGDFTYWRARFGNAAGSGAGAGQVSAIPEPSAIVLLLTALATSSLARRRG